MINATRSTESKKTAEAPSKPVEQPKAAEARVASESKPPEPAVKADEAAVSQEAAESSDEDAMMERVKARVSERTRSAGSDSGSEAVGADENQSGSDAVGAEEGEKDPGKTAGEVGQAAGSAVEEPPTPEEQALENLDRYTNLYDNPGDSGDPDGKISREDIENIASGDYDRVAAREYLEQRGVSAEEIDQTLASIEDSAKYLNTHDDLYDDLDTGNDREGDPDGTISRGDISRVLFDRQSQQSQRGDLPPGESAPNRDTYPEVDTMDERTPEVIAQQEQQVLEAVTSGQPVQFTNANGQTEQLQISQVDSSGGNTVYEITGEDGHKIRISSELSASDNRAALARVADYYSQLPPGVRDTVSEIELLQHADESAAADYQSGNDHIRFYDGLENLNEEVFNHEYGHGIGFDASDNDNGFFGIGGAPDGAPRGWEEAREQDMQNPSDYAGTSYVEDFADSWAAYLEARENGPEALQHLMEEYPNRFAILDQIYQDAA